MTGLWLHLGLCERLADMGTPHSRRELKGRQRALLGLSPSLNQSALHQLARVLAGGHLQEHHPQGQLLDTVEMERGKDLMHNKLFVTQT